MPEEQNSTGINSDHRENISARLFKNNSLVVVKKSCWGGGSTVRRGDEEIFGSTNFDSNFFKRGGVMLVSKVHLEPFQSIIGKLSAYMSAMGKMFLTRGITIVRNDRWPEIQKVIREAQAEMETQKEIFLANYPEIVQARTQAFDSAHPEHAGRLNPYFPSPQELEKSFEISFVTFVISDSEAIGEIFAEERSRLRGVASQFVDSLAVEFRQTVLESVVAFKESIEKSEDSVHGKSVNGFRRFLDRIESQDFLGDKQVSELLQNLKFGIDRVDNWKISNGNLELNEVREQLAAVIDIASKGETSDVVRAFAMAEEADVTLDDMGDSMLPVMNVGDGMEGEIEITPEESVPSIVCS